MDGHARNRVLLQPRAAVLKARPLIAACVFVVALGASLPSFADESATIARGETIFVREVLPVFKAKCFACHGEKPNDVQGGFNMLTHEGLLKGGESGEAAIAPGRPDESLLYQAVRWESLEMPPKENDRLTDDQIESIRLWIEAGAPWPDEERAAEIAKSSEDEWNRGEGVRAATSGGLSGDWTNRLYKAEDLWAYQKLWKDETGELDRGARNPIDVLIERRLAELGLEPAPRASRRTLIRRATFDLIGLPPTPAEIEAFVNDPAPDKEAFATVVERLLASPHYGEQWARHWLDVTRYADSAGYSNDYEHGNAWRYRDYVVRSFNADKPYDQFVREQIAGDEIDPNDPEMLIAVGFLRMGPWELTSMEVPKVARQRFLDDVTDAVGQVFLGHMLQCARCHDHKFDPVPTRDYYAIQAVFATTQLAERRAEFLPSENCEGFEEKKYLIQRREYYERTLEELAAKNDIAAARRWYQSNGVDPTAFEAAVSELTAASRGKTVTINAVRKRMMEQKVDASLLPPANVGLSVVELGVEKVAGKGLQRLKWRMERYEPFALSVYSGHTPDRTAVAAPLRMPRDPLKGELEQTAILTNGDPFSPTEPVAPGVLSAAASLAEMDSRLSQIPTDVVGRRAALAEWIASEQNPLTARVMVNRIWQWHFGRALAGNPNNVGATGGKPTHPELLDYLAGRFMREGWSIKAVHRLIMSSDAYQRASEHPQPEALAEKDPLGETYARFLPRRLEAEELRDAMLFVSGELNLAIGGIPARPEMNLEAALQPRQVMGGFAEAWQPSPLPEQRHRRSIYALRLRGQRDPLFELFNAPSPEISCERRESSTVTPQVFALFNSEATYDRALALANRVMKEHASPEAAVEELFRLAYGRAAKPEEVDACLTHWRRMTERHRTLAFAPPEYPTSVVREATLEQTGDNFTFVEPLEVYADFVPDLKPHAASPELRGLAEVCLVLLNSNEFAYVY